MQRWNVREDFIFLTFILFYVPFISFSPLTIAYLLSDVQMGTKKFNAGANPAMYRCIGIPMQQYMGEGGGRWRVIFLVADAAKIGISFGGMDYSMQT